MNVPAVRTRRSRTAPHRPRPSALHLRGAPLGGASTDKGGSRARSAASTRGRTATPLARGITTATTVTDGLDSFYRDYAPFGDLRSGTFDPGGVITGFTGHDHDRELGLIDMKGRVYDPSAGRFLSADPFMDTTQTQGINPYSYVGNDPLNWTDPSGFMSFNDVMHYVVGGFVGLGAPISPTRDSRTTS